MTDFSNIKGIIWDFDGTKTCLHDGGNTNAFYLAASYGAILKAAEEAGIETTLTYEDVAATQRESFEKYGYTYEIPARQLGLDSLRVHHHMHELLSIKDICEETPGLRSHFAEVSNAYNHVILTHASAGWVHRGLKLIGLEDYYSDSNIITLPEVGREHGKDVSRKSFDLALERLGTDAKDTVVLEDSERNLKIPYEMGMTTILISKKPPLNGHVHATFATATHFLQALKNG